MLVSQAFIADSRHGVFGCVRCHAGDPTGATRAVAHVGLIADPSRDPAKACSCHSIQVADSANSLHATLDGIRQSLIDRTGGGSSLTPTMTTVFNNHCSSCHATCGNCHVSVPAAAGGGLLSKHQFRRTPPLALVCTACHGSRVGDEYQGSNPGVPADVHYNRAMTCTACHSGAEMHGRGAEGVKSRYEVATAPRCQQCHPDDDEFKAIAAHTEHRDGTTGRLELSCYVCHAATYKNCSSCHVSIDPTTQKPVFEVNAPSHESLMTFKIGRNPAPDSLHPEKWVVVRHAPADPANYDHYGAGLSSTFDDRATWRMATPHNIQRRTAQTTTPPDASCKSACHGQRALFLAPADLASYEEQANQAVVVSDADLPSP